MRDTTANSQKSYHKKTPQSMYQIIAHVRPTEQSEHYRQVEGAYAVLFINYKDIDGAYALARYYIQDNGWEVLELEEEYYPIETIEDMNFEHREHYEDIMEYGYSLIFNTYENAEE